jgi:hypothetical protein
MPNYCTNTLTIVGNDKTFDKVIAPYITTQIVKDFNDQDEEVTMLDFEKVIPFPKCIAETKHLWSMDATKRLNIDHSQLIELIKEAEESNLEECGYKSWYDWSVEHWGTKWNSDSVQVSESGAGFVTAWSPPCEVIQELAKQLKCDLRLTYIEEGEFFCGEFLAGADGSVVDNCYSIKDAPQDLLDELGYEEWEENE